VFHLAVSCRPHLFGKLIDQLLADKIIGTSEMVYREIVNYGSELGQWIKTRKQNGLCIAINPDVEDHYAKIAEYVQSRYDNPNANEFLRGADGWIIAHAIHSKSIAVSQESQKHSQAKKARIPDVCDHFNVKCIKLIDMLKAQDAVL
jgi:hypothetical protein